MLRSFCRGDDKVEVELSYDCIWGQSISASNWGQYNLSSNWGQYILASLNRVQYILASMWGQYKLASKWGHIN